MLPLPPPPPEKSYITFKLGEELFDGHIANEMTLGEAIVRGILSTPNDVTTVYQYQKDRMRVDNLRSPGIQDVNRKVLDQEAKRYFEAHGDLNVPADYVSPGGYNLGNWVKRQRYTRHNPEKSCAVLTEEWIAKLDEIGMRWEKSNSKRPSEQAAQAETVTAKAG